MSIETFEREMFRQEVYLKLAEAEAEFLAGTPTISHTEFMQKMRAKVNDSA
jgi:hypothetical protein